MDLRGQLSVLRAHRLLVIGSVVVAMLAALVVSLASPRIYESHATLIVGQSLSTANPDIGQIDTSQRLGATYAQIATTRPILDAVILKLDLTTTPDELRESIEATAATNSTLLTITVDQPDPAIAAAIANEIGAQLIAASPAVRGERSDVQEFVLAELRTLQGQIELAQTEADQLEALGPRTKEQDQRLAALESRLGTLRSAYATLHSQSVTSAANQLSVVEPAVAATKPVLPNVPLNVLFALLAGCLVGVGAAFVIEHLDDSLKTAEDAEAATGLSVLGTVPQMRDLPDGDPIYSLVTLSYPRSGAAESFRVLRTNLEFAEIDSPVRSIVVTSALSREGKTTSAANLAIAFAQAGRRTLLVDADLRRPRVHTMFGVKNGSGLTDLLRTDAIDAAMVMHSTQDPNLHVVASGPIPPNPAELVGSARMRVVLAQLVEAVDVVILDTPPVNIVTDAVVLATLADGTILVIESGRTRRDAALAASDALRKVGVRVFGLILNRSKVATDRSYEYYEDERAKSGIEGPNPGGLPARAEESGS